MIVINLNSKQHFDVYGGRPRGGGDPRKVPVGQPGWLGNPYVVDDPEGTTREDVLRQFKRYFWQRLNSDPLYRRAVLALNDKTVACFCTPKRCHLDVINDFLVWVITEPGQAWLNTVDPPHLTLFEEYFAKKPVGEW